MNFNEEILNNKIVFLQPNDPFTWSSGIKSPIYCDNRLILQYPVFRTYVIEQIKRIVEDKYPEAEVVMGTSTAGIPHATLLADKMELPCGYVRGSSKAHGRQNQIEGTQVKGKKVVVVEDLISTGGSCLDVVRSLKEAQAEVLGVVCIFSYDLKKAKEAFKQEGVQYYSISTINKLLDYVEENKKLTKEEINIVKEFTTNL